MFDRRVTGDALTFGVSGMLRQSNLIMWDQETETWWQQGTMQGIVGEHSGERLKLIPSQVISWADFQETYPQGTVLSRLNTYPLYYGVSPYEFYDSSQPSLFEGQLDARLPATERVVGLTLGGSPIAYPFQTLSRKSVLYQTLGGQEVVILFAAQTVSPTDQRFIQESRAVGNAGVFLPVVDGRRMTLRKEGGVFLDQETGSTWNILGKAIAGALKGHSLPPVFHTQPFWFYWQALHPDTEVYQ